MTPAQIDAARTPRGGWTRAQLAEWGVPWPPPKGWRQRLLGRDSRSKPDRATTPQSGVVHESGGAGTAIAQTPSEDHPNEQ
jgi:hypothetical protein